MSPPIARRLVPIAIGLAVAIGGLYVALHYQRLGLTLSHYDARGHLIVARRIVDSITPGWQQFGAVWLPLPHLLNAIPAQIDLLYRSGAAAVAISIASFAVGAGAIAWIVLALTRSAPAAAAAAAVYALNPNLLYLQATPMTEPLLIALTTASVAMLLEWNRAGVREGRAAKVGILFALACLTRYEAWPVTACALAAAVWARWRRGDPIAAAAHSVAPIAAWPAAAIAGFMLSSRIVIGQWFVSSGFFVPENEALGRPMVAAAQVAWGAHTVSGPLTFFVGAAGAAALLIMGVFSRRGADALIALSLAATAAVPWAAYVNGHPFRIRYAAMLLVVEAIGAGFLAGLTRRAHIAAAMAVLAVAGYELRPLDPRAPFAVEAQWDRPNSAARQRVTDCLVRGRDGEKVMASMGSLGHYMQETARAGFALRDYLHEGNGDIWLAALEGARPFAGWVLVDEGSEGGDMLARRAREHPDFLEGYSRVCEGGSVVLYRRDQKRRLIVSR